MYTPVAAKPVLLWEASNMIDSIEIFADSQRITYIKDAWYLLSIINQRKHQAESQLCFKDDYREEFKVGAFHNNVSAGNPILLSNMLVPSADLTVADESDLRDVATYQKWQETKKSFRQ